MTVSLAIHQFYVKLIPYFRDEIWTCRNDEKNSNQKVHLLTARCRQIAVETTTKTRIAGRKKMIRPSKKNRGKNFHTTLLPTINQLLKKKLLRHDKLLQRISLQTQCARETWPFDQAL